MHIKKQVLTGTGPQWAPVPHQEGWEGETQRKSSGVISDKKECVTKVNPLFHFLNSAASAVLPGSTC